MRTRVNAESRREVDVAWSQKCFCHNVCQHHRRLAVLKLNLTTLDFIANVVVLDVDVLGPTMVHRILRHLDARLVILHDLELGSRLVLCGIQNLA